MKGESTLYEAAVCKLTYVKSPVASLCLNCSSVRKRVRVTMSVLIFSWATGEAPLMPFDAMMSSAKKNYWMFEDEVPR